MFIKNTSTPVLVLVSSQHGGLGAIRSLGRARIPVYSVHRNSWEPASRSRYVRRAFCWDFASAPEASSVSFLLGIAKQIGERPMLVATCDTTARLVAENADALAKAYVFQSPPVNAVRIFSSKKETHDLCHRLGIPTADISVPTSRMDALNFAANKFPVIVKGEDGPFVGVDGRSERVVIATSEEELLKIYDLNADHGSPRFILQEYIPGGDDTIWMFNGYFNERSECLFGATGQKLHQYPAHRGSTSLGVCVKSECVEKQTLQLLQAVNYRGPVDLGYRFDARDGSYKVLDVNPRIGMTFRLFTAENGLDVIRAAYLDVTGQVVPADRVPDGRKWIVETNDLVSSWRSYMEGLLTPAAWLQSLQGVQEGVWLDSDDPAPAFMLPGMPFRGRLSGKTDRLVSGEIKAPRGESSRIPVAQ